MSGGSEYTESAESILIEFSDRLDDPPTSLGVLAKLPKGPGTLGIAAVPPAAEPVGRAAARPTRSNALPFAVE